MHPVLFELGPLTVRWYGVMMGLALLLSVPITAHFAARFGLDRSVVDAIAVPFLRPFDGAVWWSAIIASSILRFGLDLLRPEDRTPAFLTLGQMAALVLIAWGVWFLCTAGRRRADARPAGSKTLVSASSTPREVRR